MPPHPENSTVNIHPQALVSPLAKLGQRITIGAFSIIEPGVDIGDDCTLASRVVIKTGTTLGNNNTVYEGSVLGGFPQHTRMPERLGAWSLGRTTRFAKTARCTAP